MTYSAPVPRLPPSPRPRVDRVVEGATLAGGRLEVVETLSGDVRFSVSLGALRVPVVVPRSAARSLGSALASLSRATDLPHSRACGIACRGHGVGCARDCPTCGGRS